MLRRDPNIRVEGEMTEEMKQPWDTVRGYFMRLLEGVDQAVAQEFVNGLEYFHQRMQYEELTRYYKQLVDKYGEFMNQFAGKGLTPEEQRAEALKKLGEFIKNLKITV